MSHLKDRAAVLHASPEDVEAQFYDALRDGDLERVMAAWSDDDDIVCVHPGGARVVGPQAVRAAFEAIFANGSVVVHAEHVKRVHTMGCAVHSVLERIDVITAEGPRTGWIVATNVYVKTSEGWRMVAHHASPGGPDEIPDISDTPSVLH